ncbi:MAG: galactokinase family protein, partial [Oscillospiraceae bacterium]|nr:galactokinase family protein [Oscillospiraceae bacterium]
MLQKKVSLEQLYPENTEIKERVRKLRNGLVKEWGAKDVRFFSAPGRSEIGGNHTDHQHGRILACAVDLDMLAAASSTDRNEIRIFSDGFGPFSISLDSLEPIKEDEGTSVAFLRGVADYFTRNGKTVGAFDAYMDSQVPAGASLSSSACLAVLFGEILNGLFNDGECSPTFLALAAKWAENVHYGKPCGLMDQLASATGGFIAVDFYNETEPAVEKIEFDLKEHGYALCILNAGGSHANLSDQYAAIPAEMRTVAEYFGREYLSDVTEEEFYSRIGELRGKVTDRSIMRAMHFLAETQRARLEAEALKADNLRYFLSLANASGYSSESLLENIAPSDENERSLALGIGYAKVILAGKGACRVQGGGFAGTAQAFVPLDFLDEFISRFER